MKSYKDIQTSIRKLEYTPDASMHKEVLTAIEGAWENRQCQSSSNAAHRLSRFACLTLSLPLIVLICIVIFLFLTPPGPAYALEQTAEAVKDMRFFHFRLVRGPDNRVDREAWVEYDNHGQIKAVRADMYFKENTHSMVWSGGTTQYWASDTNELTFFRDWEYSEKILFFANRYDPIHAIDYLQTLQEKGSVQIQIDMPTETDQLITCNVVYEPNTYVIGSPKPKMRELFHVDPTTYLIDDIHVAVWRDNQFNPVGTWEYLGYNQPFAPGLFDLSLEVPEDANAVDLSGILMGIGQGVLCDEDAAVVAASAFLDAWIAGDYEKAVQVHGFINTGHKEVIRLKLAMTDVLGVQHLGDPTPARPPLPGFTMPCTIEVMENYSVIEKQLEIGAVRRQEQTWGIRTFNIIER